MFSAAIHRLEPSDSPRSMTFLEPSTYHNLDGDFASRTHVPRDRAWLLSDHDTYISRHSIDQDASFSDQSATREGFSGPGSFSGSRSPPEYFDGPSVQYHVGGHPGHLPREESHVQYSPSRRSIDSHTVLPQPSMDVSILVPSMSHPPKPPSVTTTSSSTQASLGDSPPWQTPPKEYPVHHVSRSRKARREKPHIQLAPDQPPTTQGKPRARVYVACIQCRTRKIRCDGAKPVCHNCGRRSTETTECSYDAAPKRRGPDKMPGARQRMARDVRNEIDSSILPTRRRRRRRDNDTAKQVVSSSRLQTETLSDQVSGQIPPLWPLSLLITSPTPEVIHSPEEYLSPVQEFIPSGTKSAHMGDCGCPASAVYAQDFLEGCERGTRAPYHNGAHSFNSYLSGFDPPSSDVSYVSPGSQGYITNMHENQDDEQEGITNIASEPSLDFTRKIWWDSLLSLYSAHFPTHTHQRDIISNEIVSDLKFLFRTSNYWFAFFHVPSFFATFYDPKKRERMQPSLVLALLAIATFWQSSEIGNGSEGRERALRFRDEAQGSLEASFNSRWVDETLAQAAWLLALFEVCAHPRHSTERTTSAMVMLDSIIRSLSLTSVDAGDRHTSLFSPRAVPVVSAERHWPPQSDQTQPQISLGVEPHSSSRFTPQDSPAVDDSTPPIARVGCSCASLALGANWNGTMEHTPLWASTPAWSSESEGEIRKESCRRLCWSSMILSAGHISYSTAHSISRLDLFVADPANYALLFTGESLATRGGRGSKDTIWALYDRSFLLWHSCMQIRHDPTATEAEKAHFGVAAWLEADAIENALNKHTCDMEKNFIYQGREYLFNTRICVSFEFRRYIPLVSANVNGLFHRKKAEEWLSHQANVAKRFMYGLHMVTGHTSSLLLRRPFFVFWFMCQVTRGLSLWACDNSLTVALDVCKSFLPPIDYLTSLWPCAEQRNRYKCLRERLTNACYIAGVPPPPPPNLVVPKPSSPEVI